LFTVSWFLLVLRNSGKPDGERAVLCWATGMSLAWGIAMAILLPWLDAGNSYRSMMISLGKAIPPGTQEVAGISVWESPRAMLDYYVGVKVRRFEPKDQNPYDLLLVKDNPDGKEQVDAGWRKIWEGARPGDTKEVFYLLFLNRRNSYVRRIVPPMHLLFILVIALVVFGPGKLPELGAGLGKGIREFKKAMSEGGKEFNNALSDAEKKTVAEECQKEGSAKSV
jgi:TatA/E family protein of Tat protein translocase